MRQKTLYLETSGKICSVCVAYGKELISLQKSIEHFSHASEVTILAKRCLDSAGILWSDLDAIAVCDGPGSYTGLRVGLSAAKGMCFGLDIPLLAINALDALAYHARSLHPDAYIFPMIDARRMEVYMSGYDSQDQKILQTDAVILTANTFEQWGDAKKVLIGSGATKSKELYHDDSYTFEELTVSAPHLIHLGDVAFAKRQFMDLANHTPFYLKPPNITMPKAKE